MSKITAKTTDQRIEYIAAHAANVWRDEYLASIAEYEQHDPQIVAHKRDHMDWRLRNFYDARVREMKDKRQQLQIKAGLLSMRPLYDMDGIIRYSNGKGYHFFDADTKRFFNSRIDGMVYHVQVGNRQETNVFITSERYEREPRMYTIRQLQESGSIETIGEFQQYATLRAARRAIETRSAFTVKQA